MKSIFPKLNSGLYGSLLLLLFFISCKNEKSRDVPKKTYKKELQKQLEKDSLVISIELPTKIATGFNIEDKYVFTYFLGFTNNSEKDTVIIRTIHKDHSQQIIRYIQSFFTKNQRLQYKHYYYIDKNTNKISFIFKNGDLLLKEHEGKVIVADELLNAYEELRVKIFRAGKNNKNKIIHLLDSIYQKFNTKYSNEESLMALNKMEYIDKLQAIHPNNDMTGNFLKNLNEPLIAYGHNSIRYNYIKDNVLKFNFNELNTQNYSKYYLREVELGLFLFLRNEPNRGKKKYEPALNWLKTTNFYKKDSIFIKSKILPLNNKEFINKLENLQLLNTNFNETTFAKTLQQHPSNYYLIDFWATWCAPCIGGIKKMQTMHIPNNVKVISLSVDKLSVQNTWKSTTKKLAQKITYLVNVKSQKSRDFLKFIELNTIPRYILIDKNMNLIDQAFFHPSEPQFLPKLQDVRNSKYW